VGDVTRRDALAALAGVSGVAATQLVVDRVAASPEMAPLLGTQAFCPRCHRPMLTTTSEAAWIADGCLERTWVCGSCERQWRIATERLPAHEVR
jgi:hypothetical protein